MAEKDIEIKSITGDSVAVEPAKVDKTATFMKLAGLALGSYFLAKKDPYVLDGLSKELRRQEEAAAQAENEFVKGAAGSISEVLAKNSLDREKRINTNRETMDVLVGYGMDSVLAAKATDQNMGKELQALRKKYPNMNLNKVYKQINATNIVGMTNKDLAKVLIGEPTKLNMDYKKLGGPKTQTFLSGFLGTDTTKNTQDRIKRLVESKQITAEDDIDYKAGRKTLSEIQKSEYGKQMLALASTKDETIPQKRRGIADQLKGYMGVEVGVGGDGGYTFTSGSKENATLFKNLATALEEKINDISNKNKMSAEPDPSLTTSRIRENLINQFTETIEVPKTFKDAQGRDKTRIDVVVRLKKDENGNYLANKIVGQNILPKSWSPTVGGADTVSKVSSVVSKEQTIEEKIAELRKKTDANISMIKNSDLSPSLQKSRITAEKNALNEKIKDLREGN